MRRIGHNHRSFLALAARHVIDDYCQSYDGVPLSGLHAAGTFNLQAVIFLSGTTGEVWEVREICCVKEEAFTDIVVLRLSPLFQHQTNYCWRKPRLQLAPPLVGTKVAAFGYHSTMTNLTEHAVEFSTNPYTSCGEVIEVHASKRDNVMLPFPCFRVNSRFDHAMSGGPVFTESGRLCGLICCSLTTDPADPEIEHLSYVASLWPIVAICVSINRAGDYPQDTFYPLMELFRDGFLMADDAEKVSLTWDRDTGDFAVQLAT